MAGRADKGRRDRRSILTIMFVRDSCSKQLDSDRLAAYVPEGQDLVFQCSIGSEESKMLNYLSDREFFVGVS